MRIMTSDDSKQVSLEVFDDIHDFCIKNNIRYSLSGGTLIGAIRHGGYIPWDDDIDIYMPRPDYERFLKSYKSSNKFRLFAKSLSNSEMVYARVCEMEKTFVTSRLNFWTKEEKGVWIDIFPVDGAGDTYEEACKRVKFEGREYMITEDYDQFLRDTFGDYMQLPPENERVPRHSFNEFYWK